MLLAFVGDAGRTDGEWAGASAAQQSTVNVPHLNRKRLRLRCLFAPYALNTFNFIVEDCHCVCGTPAELTRFLPSLDSGGGVAALICDVTERGERGSIMLAIAWAEVFESNVQLDRIDRFSCKSGQVNRVPQRYLGH